MVHNFYSQPPGMPDMKRPQYDHKSLCLFCFYRARCSLFIVCLNFTVQSSICYILTHRTYSHYSLSIDDDFNFESHFFTTTFASAHNANVTLRLLLLLLLRFLFPGEMYCVCFSSFFHRLLKYVLFKTNAFALIKMAICKMCVSFRLDIWGFCAKLIESKWRMP